MNSDKLNNWLARAAKIGVSIGVVLLAATLVISESQGQQNIIDELLESAVDDGSVPAVVAMAATRDGVVYVGGAGFRDDANEEPVSTDTIVRIASMTKAVTSVAVMQLVEQGTVDLDEPIERYVPRLGDVQVLASFNDNGEPVYRPATTQPTVRQLLSHTSGFVYPVWNADAYQLDELADGAADEDPILKPLASDPGTRWEYGISTDVLGVLIETLSRQRLNQYFRERIFDPLRMSDTHFLVPEDDLERMAVAYARTESGEFNAMPYSPPDDRFFSGGGGLYSTANDYVRFLMAILRNGELDGARILSEESIELMAQNQIGELEAANSMVTYMPTRSNDVNFLPSSADKFGLGFLINTDPIPDGRAAGSLAWAGLYNTYYWIDRDSGVCGLFITQILPFYDAEAVRLLSEFETAIYKLPELTAQ